jgi:hypothetical protein
LIPRAAKEKQSENVGASQLVAFHTLAMLRPQHLHVVDVANAEQLDVAAIRFALAVIAIVIASCP